MFTRGYLHWTRQGKTQSPALQVPSRRKPNPPFLAICVCRQTRTLGTPANLNSERVGFGEALQKITMFTHSMWEFLLMLTSTKSCRIHIPRTVILPKSRTKSSWCKWSHLDLRYPDLNFLRRTSQLLFSADHTCTKLQSSPREQDPEASWANKSPVIGTVNDSPSTLARSASSNFPTFKSEHTGLDTPLACRLELTSVTATFWILQKERKYHDALVCTPVKGQIKRLGLIEYFQSNNHLKQMIPKWNTTWDWYTFSSLKMIELFPPFFTSWYPLVNLHSYWKLPFLVSFPIENGDFP